MGQAGNVVTVVSVASSIAPDQYTFCNTEVFPTGCDQMDSTLVNLEATVKIR